LTHDQRIAFVNKVRLYSALAIIVALTLVLLFSLRILADALGYLFASITATEMTVSFEIALQLGERISAISNWDELQLSTLGIGMVTIFSHMMLVYCLLKYWLRQFGSATSSLYESAKTVIVPDERDEIPFSTEQDVVSVGRQLGSRKPFDYSIELSRTTRILISNKAPQVLPVFRSFFESRETRIAAPIRMMRYLLVTLFTFGVVTLLLFWADGTPAVVTSFWLDSALIALVSVAGLALISAASSLFDNRLLRGLLANRLLNAKVERKKSEEPVALRVSSLSLSKHLVDKLDDEPVFSAARLLIDNDEGRSKSVQDTGDFAVNIISEGTYTEESNPMERLGRNRVLFGAVLSVIASMLLAVASVPQVLSEVWSDAEVSVSRLILAPVVISAVYAVAAAFSKMGKRIQADGSKVLLTDWISSEITFTEFYGQVAASTGRRLNQAGLIAEEEKSQVCQTNYRATSALVSFVSDAPGGKRYPFAYQDGNQSKLRLQALACRLMRNQEVNNCLKAMNLTLAEASERTRRTMLTMKVPADFHRTCRMGNQASSTSGKLQRLSCRLLMNWCVNDKLCPMIQSEAQLA
jgi:hypothetical protein